MASKAVPDTMWQQQARQLIKIEMLKANKDYAWLAKQLSIEKGILINKVNRGRFSTAFFLEALTALGTRQITIPDSANHQESK